MEKTLSLLRNAATRNSVSEVDLSYENVSDSDVAEVCSGTSASCPPDGFVSQGSADPPLCSGVNVCDGGGTGLAHCKLKMGESCTLGAECASGVCDVGVCF